MSQINSYAESNKLAYACNGLRCRNSFPALERTHGECGIGGHLPQTAKTSNLFVNQSREKQRDSKGNEWGRYGVLRHRWGPAGLAAAIAARMKGFDVTVADGAKPPIDKACGEG